MTSLEIVAYFSKAVIFHNVCKYRFSVDSLSKLSQYFNSILSAALGTERSFSFVFKTKTKSKLVLKNLKIFDDCLTPMCMETVLDIWKILFRHKFPLVRTIRSLFICPKTHYLYRSDPPKTYLFALDYSVFVQINSYVINHATSARATCIPDK